MNQYVGKHAVVIGGSLTGLNTARVLHDHFEQVTIVDRDRLPASPETRSGVPQGRHVHVLLKKGEHIYEELYPGLVSELTAAGARMVDWGSDIRWYHTGGYRVQYDSGFRTLIASRWMFEWNVRRRVAALPRVRILDGTTATGLITDPGRARIVGVKLRRGNGAADPAAPHDSEERADLFVDASGRESKLPMWLPEMGYAPPAESRVSASIGYASRVYRRTGDHKHKIVAVFPTMNTTRRLGMLIQIETGEWLCSLSGSHGDYPPTDDEGFLEWSKALSTPDIYNAIKSAEPVTPIHSWRRTDSQRRHYESAPRFPDRLLVAGDAFCAFNPWWGGGITMAAMGPKMLDDCLRVQGDPLANLAKRFHGNLAKSLNGPWFVVTSEDLRYPETIGPKLPFGAKYLQAYMDRVIAAAAVSQDVYRILIEVNNMTMDPGALFAPNVAREALFGHGRRLVHARA